MVDNFDQIRSLLKFDTLKQKYSEAIRLINDTLPEEIKNNKSVRAFFNTIESEPANDCYYVQLLRRQSDDPHTDGMADPRYHGNMHSRSVKDYLIPSLDAFDKAKPDIIEMCKLFNVRAYIRLNKRSYKSVDMAMLKGIVDQLSSGTFGSPYNLVASAAGQVCDAGENKSWIVDLDEEYLPYQEDIFRMMFECEPYVRNLQGMAKVLINSSYMSNEDAYNYAVQNEKANTPVIPTKHGRHIISKPFNVQTMTNKWNDFCKDNGITLPLPRVFIDPENKFMTFELTDVYLNKSKEFESFLPAHRTVQKDKNKISFIMDKLSDWDLHMLDFYWHGHCLKNSYWMKMCDIHKDNPTILYVPQSAATLNSKDSRLQMTQNFLYYRQRLKMKVLYYLVTMRNNDLFFIEKKAKNTFDRSYLPHEITAYKSIEEAKADLAAAKRWIKKINPNEKVTIVVITTDEFVVDIMNKNDILASLNYLEMPKSGMVSRRQLFLAMNKKEQLDYVKEFIDQHIMVNIAGKLVDICNRTDERVWFSRDRSKFVYKIYNRKVMEFTGRNAGSLNKILNNKIKEEIDWNREFIELTNRK